MPSLKEKAAQYIQDKGIPAVAQVLGIKESTVKTWGSTGKYPIALLELVDEEDLKSTASPEKEDYPRTATEATWTPESLDKLASTLNIVVDKLQELHEWKSNMVDRFDPKPITPLPPSRSLPPAESVAGGEFLEANAVRPGPMSPTPVMLRGEPPPSMLPPAQVQPTGLNQRPQKHWLEQYDYRSRR